jgi:hypothetical protein
MVVEQSAKMHAISTTCTTLSHIRNLRSKVILSWWNEWNVSTQDEQKGATHMLICLMSLVGCIRHLKEHVEDTVNCLAFSKNNK